MTLFVSVGSEVFSGLIIWVASFYVTKPALGTVTEDRSSVPWPTLIQDLPYGWCFLNVKEWVLDQDPIIFPTFLERA